MVCTVLLEYWGDLLGGRNGASVLPCLSLELDSFSPLQRLSPGPLSLLMSPHTRWGSHALPDHRDLCIQLSSLQCSSYWPLWAQFKMSTGFHLGIQPPSMMGVFTRQQAVWADLERISFVSLSDLALSADACFWNRWIWMFCLPVFLCSVFMQARRKSGSCQSILAINRSLILFWTLLHNEIT